MHPNSAIKVTSGKLVKTSKNKHLTPRSNKTYLYLFTEFKALQQRGIEIAPFIRNIRGNFMKKILCTAVALAALVCAQPSHAGFSISPRVALPLGDFGDTRRHGIWRQLRNRYARSRWTQFSDLWRR